MHVKTIVCVCVCVRMTTVDVLEQIVGKDRQPCKLTTDSLCYAVVGFLSLFHQEFALVQ